MSAPPFAVIVPISIHALREEGDDSGLSYSAMISLFLSTPSARRATSAATGVAPAGSFLSTPSARRATDLAEKRALLLADFYPRPPRGGRRACNVVQVQLDKISIHALCEEGDDSTYNVYDVTTKFLSPPTAWWATPLRLRQGCGCEGISIHALREEGDVLIWARQTVRPNFYPRPPRGGRLQTGGGGQHVLDISIHALREEGDMVRKTANPSI